MMTIYHHKNKTVFEILKKELHIWTPIFVLVFFIANLIMNGGEATVNTSHPYSFQGDSLGVLNVIQRALESTWYFENWRSGYPFGSNHLDFPGSDTGTILLLKIIGVFFNDSLAAVHNIYFLFTFSLSFTTSYLVLRSFDIEKNSSIISSIAFAFSSFHFQRITHYFYISYFFIPLFFYFIFNLIKDHEKPLSKHRFILIYLGLFLSSFWGAYYASFELLIISFTLIYSLFNSQKGIQKFKLLLLGLAFVFLGLFSNIAPALIYKQEVGNNQSVAQRASSDTETYGLKIAQMLLPRLDHRQDAASNLSNDYAKSFPLVNENHTANLGVIGATGFIIALSIILFQKTSSTPLSIHLSASIILFLTIFSTIGGISSLFSILVTSQIRGWNRVSIFILFLSLYIFAFYFHKITEKIPVYKKIAQPVLAVLICSFIIWDQTLAFCNPCDASTKKQFASEKQFIKELESKLAPHAAIYQLPYLSFPESGGIHQLVDYEQIKPFLFSKNLQYSYGGMRGRDGDLFFSKIKKFSTEKQILILKNLGFSAIFIDRRGYADSGKKIESELQENGLNLLMDDRKNWVVYEIKDAAPLIPKNTSTEKIKAISGVTSSNERIFFNSESLGSFHRNAGHINDDFLSTNGKEGFLLFGNYNPLSKGKYKLIAHGAFEEPTEAWMDVVAKSGSESILKTKLPKQGNMQSFESQFTLPEDRNDIEIRIHVQKDSVLHIKSLAIFEDK